MRWTIVLRLLPAAVIAGGFFLTLRVSSERADLYTTERAAAVDAIYEGFAESSEVEVSRLRSERDRVDGLVSALFLSSEQGVQDTVDALDAFERGPTIQAIDLVDGAGHDMVLPGGLTPIRTLPVVTSGITAITDGQWAGMLAYRVFDSNDPGRSITLILDLAALEKDTQSNLELRVEGLSEPLPLTSVSAELTEHDHQVFSSSTDQSLVAVRDIDLFGERARAVMQSKPGLLTNYETWGTDQSGYLTATGGLLSILAAVLIYQLGRRLDRRAIAREQEEKANRVALDRFNASFTHAPVGVVELDADGSVALANPRFAKLLGYLDEELEDVRFLDLVDQTERPAVAERIEQIQSGSSDAGLSERRYRDRNGSAIWVRESISMLSAEAGSSRVLVQIEDISEEKRARAELHRKALFDELTGLPNRANLVERLEQAVERSRASGKPLAVMFVDLNKFKLINDTFGHGVGDLMLIEVADRLRGTSRGTDTVARLGGDEFVILCEQINQVGGAEIAAKRYAEALNRPATILGVQHQVQASIGLVLADEGSPEDLLRRADEAMYQAKSDNGSAFVRYDASVPSASANRQSHEVALRRAVEEGELIVHYQPIMEISGGRLQDELDEIDESDRPDEGAVIVGVEALVRWVHPDEGLISPGDFLPLADRLGLLEAIDEWCIETSARQLVAWAETYPDSVDWFLGVNTSAQLYQDTDFVDRVAGILESTGLAAGRLTLEREESSIYSDRDRARRTVAELRRLGVRIVIDQFGRGPTTMTRLVQQEFDGIKLDSSFLGSDHDSDLGTVSDGLSNVVLVAEELGVDLLLGGVESAEGVRLAHSAGIRIVQGFHFSRPMDAFDLEGFIGVSTASPLASAP